MNLSKLLKNTMTLPLVLAAQLSQAEPTTIDVLVVYTPGVAARYNGEPETRFQHLLNVTNQVYADSLVDLELRMVHSVEVDYEEANNAGVALQEMTYAQHPAFENIASLRSEYGADMVVFYRPYDPAQGGCGIAWIGGNGTGGDFSNSWEKDYAFSHVAVDTCADYVTAHELGHNMGLAHSRNLNGVGGTLDYALGHGEEGNFVTIMAYQSTFNVDYFSGKIYKYSNPDLDCNGSACGIDRFEPNWGADAAYALNMTGPQIANYLETAVSDEVTDGSELQLANAQDNFTAAVAAYTAAQQDYTDAVSVRDAALTAYYSAYDNYSVELNNVNASYGNLVNAINDFNASAGQPYEVQLALYQAYLAANDAYNLAVSTYNNAVDAVNQAVSNYNIQNALVTTTSQALQTAEALVAQSQAEVDAAELVLAQF
ncbi:MAG: matrixin family metalloprotease [Pseudomonadales bacterium]|nr:matrixin family metalloprotease [Pseudomonadales bacterium]